ncbi:MAG TPA: hypothetical protein DD795_12675 [Erythrobacter sp.]|nr:hypothetical protein [Erythrobacter sp.]
MRQNARSLRPVRSAHARSARAARGRSPRRSAGRPRARSRRCVRPVRSRLQPALRAHWFRAR